MITVHLSKIARRRLACGLSIAVLAAVAAPGSAMPPVEGLPVSVVVADAGVSERVFDGVDYRNPANPRSTQTTWRVVERTGNCCENYLTATPDGTLIDFGGAYLDYSKDRGRTWRQVQPVQTLATGEGAVVVAPGGDVLAVGWDLVAMDQMFALKYDAATEQWRHMPIPFHEPFYDREWIGVVPGPVTIAGVTYPYVSFIKGGFADKDNWFFSTDGLNYVPMPSPSEQTPAFVDGGAAVVGPLPISPDPSLDWAQAPVSTGLTALGGGRMLTRPTRLDGRFDVQSKDGSWPYGLLDGKTFSWSRYARPYGGYVPQAGSRDQIDSAGRVHNVVPNKDGTGFAYRISDDGGVTWQAVNVSLPPSNTMEKNGCSACDGVARWDFRANRAVGVAALSILTHDAATKTERVLVYKFDITGHTPKLTRLMRVGLGDIVVGQATSAGSRMDYGSLSIFPDGRVAVSFIDSTTDWTSPGTNDDPANPLYYVSRNSPNSGVAIAIEGDTVLGGPAQLPRITLQAAPPSVRPRPQTGDTTVVTATVVDSQGHPVIGAPVAFSLDTVTSGAAVHSGTTTLMPTLSPRSATTDRQGRASVTYTGGEIPGDDIIKANTGSAQATITIHVTAS